MTRTLSSLILAAALASGPASAQGGFLGVTLEDAQGDAAGAVVTKVETRSAASLMGLQSGDRITRVDEVQTPNAQALAAAIGARMPGEIVELQLIRGDQVQEILGVLGRRPPMSWNGGGDQPPRPRFDVRPPPPERAPLRSDEGWNFESFELPPMAIPQFDLEEFAPRMQDLRAQMEELQRHQRNLMKDWSSQMRDLQRDFHTREWSFDLSEDLRTDGAQTRVQLRYPESTPAAERDRLRAEAIEKYGPEVEIEFSGTATIVSIERSVTRGAGSQPLPAPPQPPGSPRDGQRDF